MKEFYLNANVKQKAIVAVFFLFFIISGCRQSQDNDTVFMALRLVSSGFGASSIVTKDSDGASKFIAPTKMSIIAPKSSSTSSSIQETPTKNILAQVNSTSTSASTSTFSATSEIVKDQTRAQIFVDDPMSKNDSLQILDYLMQLTELTGYRWIVDQGAKTVTFTPPSNSQTEGDTSGASNSSKSTWVVRATSSDGNGLPPIKVEMWGTVKINNTDQNLQLQLTITESKSSTNPWGKFSLKAIATDSSSKIVAKLFAQTKDRTDGKQELEIASLSPLNKPMLGGTTGQVSAMSSWVHILRDPNDNDKTLVKASMWPVINGEPVQPLNEKTFKFTSNKSYAYAKVPDFSATTDITNPTLKETILDRTAYSNIVYRYGLYFDSGTNAGKRFIIKTGMPIEYTAADGTIRKGWANAYGVNYMGPTGPISLKNGDKVTGKDLLTGKDLGTFTVKVSPGRLSKVTKGTELLSNYNGIRLQYNSPGSATPGYNVVYYNGTSFVIEKFCSFVNGAESCSSATGTVQYQSYPNGKSYARFFLRGSSQNGGKEIAHESGSTSVYTFTYEDVTILANDLKIKSYQNIALPLTNPPSFTFSPVQVDYYVSKTELTLLKGTSSAGVPIAFSPTATPGSMAFVGQLMDNTSGAVTTTSQPVDLAYTYAWQTGIDGWNQKTMLINSSGTPVIFDNPIPFLFKDPNSGDLTEISYNGFGQLYIPWISASNDFMSMVPKFVVPDGTKLTTKLNVNGALKDVTFVVKHLSKSEKPGLITDKTKVTELITAYDGLDSNTDLNSNPKTLLSNISANFLGTTPTADTAPAIVDGEKPADSSTVQ